MYLAITGDYTNNPEYNEPGSPKIATTPEPTVHAFAWSRFLFILAISNRMSFASSFIWARVVFLKCLKFARLWTF